MAKFGATLMVLIAATLLLASTTTATRPCKTLFISSFSISTIPPNPNLIHLRQPRFVTVFTEISQFHPKSSDALFFEPQFQQQQQQQQQQLGYDFSSLHDRTKDILSVVVALLFGLGCGALTAAIMYLAWSLFSARSSYHSYSDYDDEEYDEIQSPKKMGYVNIPVDEKANSMPPKQGV